MSRTIWLDDHRATAPRTDVRLIEDDVSLLHALDTTQPLFVRGETLCRWMRAIARARGWTTHDVGDPSDELRARCPGMSPEQASALVGRLGIDIWSLVRPLRPREVARALWPADFWLAPTGWEHAAAWLGWLIARDLDDVERVFVDMIADQWRSEHDGLVARCYDARDRESALTVLEEWLGLRVPDASAIWPTFPIRPLPTDLLAGLRDRIRRQLIASDGQATGHWLEYGLPADVGSLMAREAKAFYEAQPRALREEWLSDLNRYLDPSEMDALRRLRPPADPGPLPFDIQEAIAWYHDRYLPWREWTLVNEEPDSLARARDIGRQFGEWYLGAYPRMCNVGHERLSWVRVHRLNESEPRYVTLLVVLDGLGVRDLQSLLGQIVQASERLTMQANDIVLAPVPTVTEFAKPALLRGLPPDQVAFDDGLSTATRRLGQVIKRVSEASPGAVVIWGRLEPDQTYHRARDWYELQTEVNSRLRAIAGHLHDVVTRVPAEVPLRIVLTSDHGRLLGRSQRTLPVPDGCQSHGRAAWGSISRDFPEQGYVIEGDCAILDADAYRLPKERNYLVSLTDASFQMNDGRGGEDWFPHGGVFPEEVFVPWVELIRDGQIVDPEVELTGDGRARDRGQVELTLLNTNDLPLTVEWLELRFANQRRRLPLHGLIGPRSKATLHGGIDGWPTREDSREVTAVVGYRLPNGDVRRQVVSSVVLMSESLYETTNILEDLP